MFGILLYMESALVFVSQMKYGHMTNCAVDVLLASLKVCIEWDVIHLSTLYKDINKPVTPAKDVISQCIFLFRSLCFWCFSEVNVQMFHFVICF